MNFFESVEMFLSEMARKTLPDGRVFRSSEAAVIELVGEGLPIPEIAQQLGTSIASVQSIISVAKRNGTWPAEGVHARPRIELQDGRGFNTLQAAVIVLVGEGLTLAEIAEQTRTTLGTIASVVSIAKRKGEWPETLQVTRPAREVRAPRVGTTAQSVAAPAQEEPEETPAQEPEETTAQGAPAQETSVHAQEPEETQHDSGRTLWNVEGGEIINSADENDRVYYDGTDIYSDRNGRVRKIKANVATLDDALKFMKGYIFQMRFGRVA